MINVNISEEDLIDMLLNRLRDWTEDRDTIELFEDYYRNLIDCGAFEGLNLDVRLIVDNDYINNLVVVDKDELPDYGIDLDKDENTDRIEVYSQYSDMYLIRSY